MFIGFWKVSYIIGTTLLVSLNSLIFIDLWLTLRNPFQAAKKRVKYYKGYVGMIVLSMTITMIYFLTADDTDDL